LGITFKKGFEIGFIGWCRRWRASGGSGLSAPVSITFLNAIRLECKQFMVTISLFFAALGFVQLPLQIHFGIMTGERFIYSTLALVPLLAFMPVRMDWESAVTRCI
jgi:hypothetical protein